MIEQLIKVSPIILPVLIVVGFGIVVGRDIKRDKAQQSKSSKHPRR